MTRGTRRMAFEGLERRELKNADWGGDFYSDDGSGVDRASDLCAPARIFDEGSVFIMPNETEFSIDPTPIFYPGDEVSAIPITLPEPEPPWWVEDSFEGPPGTRELKNADWGPDARLCEVPYDDASMPTCDGNSCEVVYDHHEPGLLMASGEGEQTVTGALGDDTLMGADVYLDEASINPEPIFAEPRVANPRDEVSTDPIPLP